LVIDMTISVELKDVSLDYPVYDYSSLSLQKTIVSLASAGSISKPKDGVIKVRSVNKLSLELKAGDKLAIIGGNGAGKTSLLKLIAGIYEPSTGHRKVSGKITTILGTGFGFDEEATGYQNIMLGGIALGYSLNEMKECIVDIAEFSELGEFLNMPLRTYSAGMRARLAFGIATCKRPDIVIIDEGIGAGDAHFIEKANQRLERFLNDASIMIMASHSNGLLEKFCNKCLYMKNGKALFLGDLKKGIAMYNKDLGD
jgi:ABC-2 type transport system ATP-binding protein/lipopolysaccharide transport system ATP-binding protein